MQHLSFEELAWVVKELKQAAPEVTAAGQLEMDKSTQFSIANLGFITLLIACVLAGFSFSLSWGWLYSLTLLLATQCVASFTDATWFIPWRSRSWNRNEIIAAVIVLMICWAVRILIAVVIPM